MKCTEMERQMYNAVGHQVVVELKNYDSVNGLCFGYTSSLDNEPEPAEIDIKREGYSGLLCLTEPEIEKIVILD